LTFDERMKPLYFSSPSRLTHRQTACSCRSWQEQTSESRSKVGRQGFEQQQGGKLLSREKKQEKRFRGKREIFLKRERERGELTFFPLLSTGSRSPLSSSSPAFGERLFAPPLLSLLEMHCRATSHASAGPRAVAGSSGGGFAAAARAPGIRRQTAVAASASSSSSPPDEPRRQLDPYLAAAAQAQAAPSSQRMPRPLSAVATSPSDSARASTDATIGSDDDDPKSVVIVAPEDFVLPPGVLGPVADRSKPLHPADVFRCPGCTRPECQVKIGRFCFFILIEIRCITTAAFSHPFFQPRDIQKKNKKIDRPRPAAPSPSGASTTRRATSARS